jgi:SAM-dependent MidA family methyltransferase
VPIVTADYQQLYVVLQVDWLTPVEVFAPWYGRALAHYMLECRKHTLQGGSSQPLAIVEIGGGTGTLAASVLVRDSCRNGI